MCLNSGKGFLVFYSMARQLTLRSPDPPSTVLAHTTPENVTPDMFSTAKVLHTGV